MSVQSATRSTTGPRCGHDVRLMTMVARIYHERGVGQRQIAASLHLSQARVSRLLRQAELEGIVRMVVLNLDRRIVGIDPAARRGIPRRIGIAGGSAKLSAIRAALAGGWVNVVVTEL